MNALQIGDPRSGKTTSLLTLEGFAKQTGKKVAILDADGKLSDHPKFSKIFKSGEFEHWDLSPFGLTESSLGSKAHNLKAPPQQFPKGYLAIADMVDKITAQQDQYCAVACDTFSSVQRHLKKLLSHSSQKVAFEFPEWAAMQVNLEEFFSSFYKMKIPLKIINVHIKHERDEQTGAFKMEPLIESGFRHTALGQGPSEVLLTTIRMKQGGVPEYCWFTHPNGQFNASSDVFGLDQLIVPQNWEPIWRELL